MTIYTRRGDAGTTSLVDGSRVPKSSARVEAYGTVDEANSAVGLARACVTDARLDDVLHFIQQKLFNCSSSLATPASARSSHTPVITADDITALERAVDRFEEKTGPLEHFVIEAGCEASARLHLARAIIRRAERRTVVLAATEDVDEQVLAFMNRCSDALFAGARYANALAGAGDELWDPTASPPEG
ncbi:MAG: cob(I)yrinic acid a,c-diamide adenosyltransferase [Coriobacteriia bacterium]|nr:cob(I)yrinic acid a,c-diamide adenosyltransferase [Coriobacteriia bacterium]